MTQDFYHMSTAECVVLQASDFASSDVASKRAGRKASGGPGKGRQAAGAPWRLSKGARVPNLGPRDTQ